MGYLTKEDIVNANDRPTEEVMVPEWGGVVLVGTMDGPTRDEWELSVFGEDGKQKKSLRTSLCAFAMIDEDGNRLFSHDEVEELEGKSCLAIRRVYEVAKRLNGIGELEKLEKNSGNPNTDDLPSD